jgi:hypothetical protein
VEIVPGDNSYTVDMEQVGRASDVLNDYSQDLSTPISSLTAAKIPAEPVAGVSVVASIKSSLTSWEKALKTISTDMAGLSTMCNKSVSLYHDAEVTVSAPFTKFTR